LAQVDINAFKKMMTAISLCWSRSTKPNYEEKLAIKVVTFVWKQRDWWFEEAFALHASKMKV
jgi:hypothetical protein